MSTFDSRCHERVPVMHQLVTHPMHNWGGLLRSTGPQLGHFPPPLPPGPPPPSVQIPHSLQYPPVEYRVQRPPPPPPMMQFLAHPPSVVHQPPPRPQPPVHQLPPLSHPPRFHHFPVPNPPMPPQAPRVHPQVLHIPVHPPLPSTPYPHSSSQPMLAILKPEIAFAPPSHQPPMQHPVVEPKPPGVDIAAKSLQEQYLVKPEPQTSSIPQSPHRCFTELPKFERSQPQEGTEETKDISISVLPSTFSCNLLDDSDDEQDGKQPTYLFHPGTIDYTYRPPPAIDPFANSKSLRHQQPSNPRRRRDDDDGGDNDEDDSDLEDETDEDFAVREEKAYQEILPKVRKLMSQVSVEENWQSDKEEKACMICPFPQRLKGWTALLQHADKFKKRRPVQHRAYYRALSEHLKRGARPVDDESAEEKAVLIDSGKLTEEVIVWPPLVIVTNLKDKENLDLHVPTIASMDIEKTLREKSNGKPGRMLVMFPASEIGLLNAKLLVESLAKLTSSQIHNNILGTSPTYNPRPNNGQHPFSRPTDHHPGIPVGHLAEPVDMISIDPYNKLISWSAENKREILKSVTKKSKEEHEREKAKVKAKLVEVDQIAESHQRFKSSKALLSQQLKDAEIALQEQKRHEELISYRHAEQLKIMDTKFKADIWRLEVERVAREGKIRALFESNEKQLVRERIQRNKELEIMKSHVANITQELEKQKAQKALEKEREIARRREEVYAIIKRRETQYNEGARAMERKLLEKHEAQKIKLVEDFHKMRQDILMEWLEKQSALKASAENAKQEKEILEREAQYMSTDMIKECSVCFLEFAEEVKRALIQPCGHARICIECAVDIYQRTKLCPICRVKMSSKPKVMPKLYM